ncbi:MAG: indolepyruvate oxidoreductase subunit beta [Coriobacteriales bacterium]|nr:indolepyruvate oxidoreductase subunit beta [Coriobacteriales bacterium]
MAQPFNIVIAGVGGQGTVLASKLLAQAALLQGAQVRTAETIGMAQRGGSVLGHVRVEAGTGPARAPLSPLVPLGGADLLIGFEPGETMRALDYLAPGKTVVTAIRAIEPVQATLDTSAATYDGTSHINWLQQQANTGRIGTLVTVDGEALCAECGSPRVLNVILLGAAIAAVANNTVFSIDALERALEVLVKPRFVEMNKRALHRGLAEKSQRGHTAR